MIGHLSILSIVGLSIFLGVGMALGGFAIYRGAGNKGNIGEAKVSEILRRHKVDVIEDVFIPNESGGLTQIDHIARLPREILVVETKTFEGEVLDAEGQEWECRSKDGMNLRISSPVKQNEWHVKMLRRLVGSNISCASAIVFASDVKFGNKRPIEVCSPEEFEKRLTRVLVQTPDSRLDEVWETIQRGARTDDEARRQHASQLDYSREEKSRKMSGAVYIAGGVAIAIAVSAFWSVLR